MNWEGCWTVPVQKCFNIYCDASQAFCCIIFRSCWHASVCLCWSLVAVVANRYCDCDRRWRRDVRWRRVINSCFDSDWSQLYLAAQTTRFALQSTDFWLQFLHATAGTAIARLSHRNSVRPSVCLSIRLSQGWIRQKRFKLGSSNLHHQLPQRL